MNHILKFVHALEWWIIIAVAMILIVGHGVAPRESVANIFTGTLMVVTGGAAMLKFFTKNPD